VPLSAHGDEQGRIARAKGGCFQWLDGINLVHLRLTFFV
jgi:hypothetical protein